MLKLLARLRAGFIWFRLPLKVGSLVLGAVGLIAVLLWVPRYQVAHTPGVAGEKRFESEDEARKTLAQMLGGAVVLLGLYFSAKTFGLSREGHITDRYTKAIEQLGKSDGDKPNIEVRLGAIYALERIALDSARDHWTIMEVLTAYVRENAPLEPGGEYKIDKLPRTEIQAILTVLGRRRVDNGREQPSQKLNLSRSRLWNADFSRGNFEGLDVSFAELHGAVFIAANLQGASLSSAHLQKAYFAFTNLREAKCSQADFRKAKLQTANLEAANLTGSRFEGAELANVNLMNAGVAWALFYDVNHLTAEQVKTARYWEKARYSHDLRRELGLNDDPLNGPVGDLLAESLRQRP